MVVVLRSRGPSMTMARVVRDEALDHLAPHDPAAIRSRRDLRRVHAAMGTLGLLKRALRDMPERAAGVPLTILELGAGDGQLMLDVARARLASLSQAECTLLDRQALASETTIAGYADSGWVARALVVDAMDWAADALERPQHWDLIVANLFIHHFESAQLAMLLEAIEACCDRFFACEPRRGWLALAGSHLVGLLGANAVTRQDAVLSVHAGFRDRELSCAWPGRAGNWTLSESAAGPFSHCFSASRRIGEP